MTCERCGHELPTSCEARGACVDVVDGCIANLRADLAIVQKNLAAVRQDLEAWKLAAQYLHNELEAERARSWRAWEKFDEANGQIWDALQDTVHAEAGAAQMRAALHGFVGFVDGGYAVGTAHERTLGQHAAEGREALATNAGRDFLTAVQRLVEAAKAATTHSYLSTTYQDHKDLRAALADPALASLLKESM